ncbi:hypothetical protein CYMTET_49431 [Cymbomonas tetramitiformis]|uniref:ABC transporter domain-containing protein n=1 Tax=Cymbomonas tetramitiformis TaxID=36881 RepID=A0AAE0EU58_9CHLO|nr:hypothetical protein CYMTET_49431 [Cymbomonas tetramitiformis]
MLLGDPSECVAGMGWRAVGAGLRAWGLPGLHELGVYRGSELVSPGLRSLGFIGAPSLGLYRGVGDTLTLSGYDVVDQRNQVFRTLGVCPQFDCCWSEMTVEEHLLLYARVRGCPLAEQRVRARQVAELVELDGDAFTQRACQLSGGMRRRLSIGISLVGNPGVLILDEPTTGLDPETRQQIWRVVDKAKSGRAIILTTHSMEEADALSTRIGIVAGGKLLCIGTQQSLKNEFGEGLQLKLGLESDADLDRLHEFIRSKINSSADVVYNVGKTCIYKLLRDTSVATVFRVMEAESAEMRVSEWSLTQTSLEQVFINVVTSRQES